MAKTPKLPPSTEVHFNQALKGLMSIPPPPKPTKQAVAAAVSAPEPAPELIPSPAMKLDREFKYFLFHQDELVAKYRGRYIVIRGEEVVGDFDSTMDAYRDSCQKYEPGTFMIQYCIPGPEAYTLINHSRVHFA